jgi:hypothetical protein
VHRGEWVVFLDADDRIEEGFLRERLKSARAAQADVALFNGWHTDSSCLQRRPVHRKQPYAHALNGHAWIQHCVAQKEWPHYLWLQMVRSSYIRKNNLRFQEGKATRTFSGRLTSPLQTACFISLTGRTISTSRTRHRLPTGRTTTISGRTATLMLSATFSFSHPATAP